MALEVCIEKKLDRFILKASFDSKEGTLALFGPSGSGKSMLLKCIAGIERPDTGRITLNGRTLFDSDKGIDLPPQQRRVGYLFQEYALFPHMTVEKNIIAGMRDREMSGREKKAKARSLLERYGLAGMAGSYPNALSGGERQRTAVLRMLAAEPECILLDEPFSALDGPLRETLIDDMRRLLNELKRPAVFVSHEYTEVERLCENIVRIENGNCAPACPVRDDIVYFDNAATTLRKPECVAQAVTRAISTWGNGGRSGHGAALAAGRGVYMARQALCELFHAEDPSCVVLTQNATQALNIAIQGSLEPGDHVITSIAEHNSVLRPLYSLREADLSFIVPDGCGRITPNGLDKMLTSKTKAIVITHGSNVTGDVTDLNAFSAFAKAHGLLLIVDASQTAGTIPIDVSALGIDVLCFTGHKGLMGPQGTGGMIVRSDSRVRPILFGGTGVKSFLETQPRELPTRLEAGTLNGHGIAGLTAAVEWIQKTGIETIHAWETELTDSFLHGLRSIPNVRIYGDVDAAQRCPIVSLNIAAADSAEVADLLWDGYRIAVRSGIHCAPLMHRHLGTESQGTVRFGFSYFNTRSEVDRAVEAVKEIAREYE